MTDTVTDYYEELTVGVLLGEYEAPSNYMIGLYNDSVDNVSAADSASSITTEPSGSGYARTQVDRVSCDSSTVNGNRRINFPTVDFNTTDSDDGIDSYFVMGQFNDGSNTNYRMITTGKIQSQDYSVDLSNIDRYTLSEVYIEHAER